ncbi:HdeD family acid-resistance protein [Rikenella microfusus]|uniref:Acid-resistance membrane protein n=1 Tax=Rikenella microfusus TaxID=28139 RepID=A0A379MRR3_9BACT|nr:DUF308 domain-containing protein [Rikenella microfusus]SUE34341.1 acid-resistance membrane protein [Rikenella microfusus]HJE88536.1 DUF308 domain-containing protein [Rikenella microfusus]
MEKYIKTYTGNSLLWGVLTALVGLVFIIWPDSVLRWAVYLVGILSLVAGIVQFLGFLARTRGVENRWRYLPLTSPLAVLWGILLLAKPDVWIELFMIVLGVVMLLMAVMQLVSLGQMRKAGIPVTGGYFVFPVLLLLAGIVVFFNPFATTVWLTVFFGAWVLAYGVVEMFDYFSLHKAVPAASKKIDAPKEND